MGNRSEVHSCEPLSRRLLSKASCLGLFIFISFGTGCGKYSPPLAPEDLSPQPVTELKVVSSPDGVAFSWRAPNKDHRGKELRTLNGYRVYRKVLEKSSDLLDPKVEYSEIALVEDPHLAKLQQLRLDAKAQGKPTRSVKVTDAEKAFSFSDTSPQSGKRYAYQIVPINQGNEEGDPGQIILVLFRGETSEVSMLPLSQVTEDIFS